MEQKCSARRLKYFALSLLGAMCRRGKSICAFASRDLLLLNESRRARLCFMGFEGYRQPDEKALTQLVFEAGD